MLYYSTRDQNPDDRRSVDFETALFSAYTSDGGLYVPRDLPKLDWQSWRHFSYGQIVAEILKAFIADDRINVNEIVQSAYTIDNFDHPDIAPLQVPYKDDMYIMELFHGPTWSFKDYSLQIVGRLLQAYLERNRKHLTLLIVTSGDTGSAAIEAVKNCANIDIVVMFAQGTITATQEKQMTSIIAKNVHVLPGQGTCGDLDNVVREIFKDADFIQKYNVGSINSINWARIMIQTAHWFYAYFRATSIQDSVTMAIPTGAAGNLCGALYAKKLGLPIKIVACNNENDSLYEWIKTGCLQAKAIKNSLASAMDIDIPYNIERIIHLLEYENASCTEKAAKTASEMMSNAYAGLESFTDPELASKLKEAILPWKVTDSQIQSTIKRVHAETGYVCCPHTATAVHYAFEHPTMRPIVCASTASPYKFGEIINKLGIELQTSQKLEKLANAPTRTAGLLKKDENWLLALKQRIIEINDQFEKRGA